MSMNKLIIGKPRNYPTDFISKLNSKLETNNAIKLAYLAQAFDPASGLPPYLVIGIDSKCGIEDVASYLEKFIIENLPKDIFLDLVPAKDGLYSEYFSSIKPFFERV